MTYIWSDLIWWSNCSRLRLPFFVSYVSNHDSGNIHVPIVTSYSSPNTLSLSHTGGGELRRVIFMVKEGGESDGLCSWIMEDQFSRLFVWRSLM